VQVDRKAFEDFLAKREQAQAMYEQYPERWPTWEAYWAEFSEAVNSD
jgi:hypothetical protein